MKRQIQALILFLLILQTGYSQTRFGVNGGTILSKNSDYEVSGIYNLKPIKLVNIGFNFNGFTEIPLNDKNAIKVDLGYEMKPYYYNIINRYWPTHGYSVNRKYFNHNLNVGVAFKKYLKPNDIFLSAGINIQKPINSTSNAEIVWASDYAVQFPHIFDTTITVEERALKATNFKIDKLVYGVHIGFGKKIIDNIFIYTNFNYQNIFFKKTETSPPTLDRIKTIGMSVGVEYRF